MSDNRASSFPWVLQMRFAERPACRVINSAIERCVVMDGADGEAEGRSREHCETSNTTLVWRKLMHACKKWRSVVLTRPDQSRGEALIFNSLVGLQWLKNQSTRHKVHFIILMVWCWYSALPRPFPLLPLNYI